MNTVLNNKEINNISEQFEGIIGNLTIFKGQINSLQQQIKGLEKNIKKLQELPKKEKKQEVRIINLLFGLMILYCCPMVLT